MIIRYPDKIPSRYQDFLYIGRPVISTSLYSNDLHTGLSGFQTVIFGHFSLVCECPILQGVQFLNGPLD
jgi:hypothetical protein